MTDPNDKRIAELRANLAAAQRAGDTKKAVEAHHELLQREQMARDSARPAPPNRVETFDGALAAVERIKQLKATRSEIANPMARALFDEHHSAELAVLEPEVAEFAAQLQSPPAGPDPDLVLDARAAEVRAAHARLLAVNPIAASAFIDRHQWVFDRKAVA